MRTKIVVTIALTVLVSSLLRADDWPCWRGANRDGISKETGLLATWPPEGPKELWTISGLGKGYASVAVVEKRIYTTGIPDKNGVLYCMDLDGTNLWKVEYGSEWTGGYPGARTTPAVDGNRIYIMSGNGVVACFEAADGKKVWEVDTFKQFDAKNIAWGISDSVLIEGDKVICTPGGRDASVVALNKNDGSTVWQSKGLSEESGYCSAMAVNHGKRRLILTMTGSSLVGLDANDGTVLWKSPDANKYKVNANTPIYSDGWIFVTSGYGYGSEVFELSADGSSVTKKWSDKKLDCHHGGAILINDCVFSANSRGQWMCVELKTGNVKFSADGIGKGCVTYADGKLICYGERGDIALVKANTEKYEQTSSFKVKAGTGEHWAHPVVSDGRLYVRHGDALTAYDIKGK